MRKYEGGLLEVFGKHDFHYVEINPDEGMIVEHGSVMIGVVESDFSVFISENGVPGFSCRIANRRLFEQNWSTGGCYLDPTKVFWNDLEGD